MTKEELIIRASTIDRDVSARKRTEEELLLTKVCMDKASITICRTSPDGKILNANDHVCRSLGYTREELVSMSIFDVDPILTRELWLEHRKKVLATGNRTFETMHRRKDGTVFPVEVTVNYLKFGGNEFGTSMARDITECKRMEEELRLAHAGLEKRVAELTVQLEKTAEALHASEERYVLAERGVNDGIWDYNLTTDKVYFSSRWKSMLGYEHFEIQNDLEEWKNRIHPEDYQMVKDTWNSYLDGRTPAFEVEHLLLHKDGGYRWILTRGACLQDSQGMPYRIAGSHTDIARHKNLGLHLPLVDDHAVREKAKISLSHADKMETLLVAEDEEIVMHFMKNILERAGYRIIVANNGEDAVARFMENEDISLVLSDIVMPKKNEKEMPDEMRKIKPGIKAVFISGYTADTMLDKGLIDSGTEFITKAFVKTDLLRKIREVLERG